MIFTGVLFLFRFLPVFIICMFLAPGRMKNVILFFGSLLFYAWGEPFGCILLLAGILMNYCLAFVIDRSKDKHRRIPLVAAIGINVGILAYFKYADALIALVNRLPNNETQEKGMPFPVGISVWTLLSLSYLISVYRKQVKPRANILEFGTYIAMFPLAFVGPIADYRSLEEQLGYRKLTAEGVSSGLKRFCFGLAKKALLADALFVLWQTVSGYDLTGISLLTAWLGIIAFCFEIYFTFSGFSDMAIGLAQLCGFTLPENFDHPLVAASVTEFWKKWHCTLGAWFGEYVCRPICGKKDSKSMKLLACLVSMGLIGMWYGTGLHFLAWGLWFGLFLCLEELFLGKVLEGFVRPVGILYTLVVVLFGWVLFAFHSFTDISHFGKAMIGFGRIIDRDGLFLLQEYWTTLAAAALFATPIFSRFVKKLKSTGNGWDIALYRLGEKVIPAVLLLLSIACIVDAAVTPFVHFMW